MFKSSIEVPLHTVSDWHYLIRDAENMCFHHLTRQKGDIAARIPIYQRLHQRLTARNPSSSQSMTIQRERTQQSK